MKQEKVTHKETKYQNNFLFLILIFFETIVANCSSIRNWWQNLDRTCIF